MFRTVDFEGSVVQADDADGLDKFAEYECKDLVVHGIAVHSRYYKVHELIRLMSGLKNLVRKDIEVVSLISSAFCDSKNEWYEIKLKESASLTDAEQAGPKIANAFHKSGAGVVTVESETYYKQFVSDFEPEEDEED